MAFTFAHFSDVHLGPMPPGAVWQDFAFKRVLGGLSWALRRRAIHSPAVAEALVADIQAHNPDHIAFTGDLINIAAKPEFPRGARWLAKVGSVDAVSFVPGNHDAYVHVTDHDGLRHFSDYMAGDLKRPEGSDGKVFPFVRLRRNVAFIGLDTARPQSLWRAGGTLGDTQLNMLGVQLRDLKARGFYRVVMLHHPPLPGLAVARKALTDAAALQSVLKAEGAELVLHGHNHRRMFNTFAWEGGVAAVNGVPSASSTGHGAHEAAEWHHYSVDRSKAQWRTTLTVRALVGGTTRFESQPAIELFHDANPV